jgi:alpha-beta hydrolase superfamily lysophospholipase
MSVEPRAVEDAPPVNPSDGSVPATSIELRIDRSLTLPGRAWCADSPRALVAIVHGLGEHCGRYAALASDLVKQRYTVVSLDLPGHGEAPGSRGDIPSWPQLRDQIVPAMFTASRGVPGQPLDLPVILLGHSMGGVIALDHALAHPRGLLAVVTSAPGLRTKMPPWWKLVLANVANVAMPAAGFPHGLDMTGISRDPEVMKARAADPLMHDKISPRLYFALAEAQQRVLREARKLQVPTLLQQGAADRVIDPRGALEFNAAAPHGMARLITYKDAYHEIYNDLAREEVIRDLVGWMEAVVVV